MTHSQNQITKMILARTRHLRSILSCLIEHVRMLIRCWWLFGLFGFAFGPNELYFHHPTIISRCGIFRRRGLIRLAALICKGFLGEVHQNRLIHLLYCDGQVFRIFRAFITWHLSGIIFSIFPHLLFWTLQIL